MPSWVIQRSLFFPSPSPQKEHLDLLKRGLASLPAPRNDYEIVVPESETMEGDDQTINTNYVEDQADVDDRREADIAAQSKGSMQNILLFPDHLAPPI